MPVDVKDAEMAADPTPTGLDTVLLRDSGLTPAATDPDMVRLPDSDMKVDPEPMTRNTLSVSAEFLTCMELIEVLESLTILSGTAEAADGFRVSAPVNVWARPREASVSVPATDNAGN